MSNAAGMNWIRQERRLAVYLRDGLSCCYCGQSVEDGAQLTLDHVIPRTRGGRNSVDNLVTSCHRCNSARSDREIHEFAASVAGYLDHNLVATDILVHIHDCLHRALPLDEAKTLIARRGSAARALKEMNR